MERYLNKIICGDAAEVMGGGMADNSVDLVITSPPYNVGKEYEEHQSQDDYRHFLEDIISEIPRILKPDGRVVWNIAISMTGKDGIFSPLLLNMNILEKYFKFRDFIVWNQINSGNDCAWGSWKSAKAPYLRHQAEALLIYYKGQWSKGDGKSDITAELFTELTKDIWSIPTATKDGHPAPFPIELVQKALHLFSYVGDVVLDPFIGSGTTAIACKRTNRNYIGIEINPEYCKLAERRLVQAELFSEVA